MELSSQVVLQGYGQFLEGYTQKLRSSMNSFESSWDINENPIQLQILNEDHCSTVDLINCESKEDACIIHLFITLINEINHLKEELLNDYLPKLKYGGEVYLQQANIEGYHIIISNVLPLYFDVLSFVRKCREVLIYILEQLVVLYSLKCLENKKSDGEVQFISLHAVYESIGDLLLLFVAVDASIACYHREVEGHWNTLKQSVLGVSGEPGIDPDAVKNLLTAMGEVQGELLTGLVFKTAVNLILNEKSVFDPECLLSFRFNRFLENQSQELEYVDEFSSQAMDGCARVLAVFVFTQHIYTIKEKKVKKFVSGFAKKIPGVALYSQVFWSPCDFIVKNLKQFSLDNRIETFDVRFPSYAEEFSLTIKSRVKEFASKILLWSLKMENCCSFNPSPVKLNDMEIINLCFEGLQLCNEMKYAIICGSRFSFILNRPISKSLALSFCKLIELLKAANLIFQRHAISIGKTSHHAVQKVSIRILSKIINSKKMLYNESKKPMYKKLYATLCHAEKLFYQSCSNDRIILVNLLPTCPSNLVDVEYNYTLIKCYCTQLETIINLNKYLKDASENIFGAAESDILPLYLKNLWDSESTLARVNYIVSKGVWVGRDESPPSVLNKEIVQPLCQQVETKVRLAALSHLNPQNNLPSKSRDLRKYFRNGPLIYDNSYYLLKCEVEKYLEKTWHDLLTVSLHDWLGYREMRSLAYHKLGLTTVEDQLPCQAPAPGLDVLELMRNIQEFVLNYRYNMNDQTFVEISSNNKHLNTITIDLIAGSIQTHGTGIVNTTTNFIYQFLRNKLMNFCQYLFDDNIKCRLIKDYNYLKEDRGRIYTYERGEKMLKSGRRIMDAIEGLRALIAQVGNALGFVRLVGASARHHSMNVIPFLPVVLPDIQEDGSRILLSLSQVLGDSLRNACNAPKHLSLLIDVFAQAFRKLDAVHAPLFALAIPPLTLCHVRHMVATKERLAKRSRTGASFADDGFTLGLTYLLQTLNLTSFFDSLQWFETLEKKYETEQNSILSSTTSDSQENNTLKLSVQRLKMFKQEFELLHYNLKSALIILSSS